MFKVLTLVAGAGVAAAGVMMTNPVAAQADFVFEMCPSGMDGVVTGTPTSCAFADNVRRSYFAGGGAMVAAYSPITGLGYVMDCGHSNFIARLSNGETHPGVLCTGCNDAAVVIW
jgi:hypothetical protein